MSTFLTENLPQANLNIIKQEMNQDGKLRTFLNTPAKDLPPHYQYLVKDISTVEDSTLYDVIVFTCMNPRFKAFFTYSGNKPVGFVAYHVGPFGIENIKMFSFNPRQNGGMILLRDLSVLIEELLDKYGLVEWIAYPGNPTNKIYDKVIKQYNGKVWEQNGELWYSISSPQLEETTFLLKGSSTGKFYNVRAKTIVEAREKLRNFLKN